MASSVIIGRVAVKVMPDTGDFRKDAQRKLDAIEKRIEVSIPTVADMTGAERSLLEGIRDLNARNRAQDSRKVKLFTILDLKGIRESLNKAVRRYEELSRTNVVKLKSELTAADLHLALNDENLRKVKEDIDHWVRQNSPIKIPVKLDISGPSSILAGLRLDRIARPRTVNLIPKVDNKAAAAALTVLAALSGGRAVSKFFSEFADWFKNLDKAIPKLAAMALAITAIGGYGLTAAANLAALSSSLASIAPAALALPGIFAGIGVGLAVTMIGFKDLKKVLPDVYNQFQNMKHVISKDFWAGAIDGVRNLANVYLPHLDDAAKQVGTFWGNLSNALAKPFHSALGPMFENLRQSIKITSDHAGVFANIITQLGLGGSEYLPRLAKWFTDISTRFSNFLSQARANGDFKRWIDTAIVALYQLGSVLANLGGILMGIGKAASAAGGSSLGLLADTLDHVNKVVNSPAFQGGLTKTFASAFQMMHNIASVAGPPLTALFESLSNTFETVLPVAGKAIGTLLASVAKLLGGVGVQDALTAAFKAINTAVQALGPAIVALEPALAQLIQFIGSFAAQLGPMFATLLTSLAPVLTALLKAAQPLMQVLTTLLTQVFQALGPVIRQLTPVIAILGKAFVQLVTPIAKALMPVLRAIMPIIGQIAKLLAGTMAQILPILGKAIAALMPSVTPLLVALGKLLLQILVPLMPAILVIVQQALPPLTQALIQLMPAIIQIINAFTSILKIIMPILVPVLKILAQTFADAVAGAIHGVTNILNGLYNIFAGIANFLAGVFTGNWSKAWNGIKQIFAGVWQLIKGIVQTVWNVWILGSFSAGWGLVKNIFKEGAAFLKGLWSSLWNGLKAGPSAMFEWLSRLAYGIFMKLRQWASDAITGIVGFFKELPAKLSSLGGAMLNAGRSLIDALLRGLAQFGGGVIAVGKAIVNSIIDGLNAVIPHHLDVNLPGPLPDIHVPLIPEIPHLAKGATILPQDGGTLAVLAEAGKSETVVDTGKVNKLIEQALRKDNGNGSNGETKQFIYNAAPGHSLSSEEDLFAATERARFAW